MTRVCADPHCYRLSETTYCAGHERERRRKQDERRPSRAQRGGGHDHQQLRREWSAKVDAGDVICWRCGNPIEPGMPWDLGHVDGSNYRLYAGPEHRECNRATSRHRAERGHTTTAPEREQRREYRRGSSDLR
jgi:hypothetical protein